MVYRFGPFVANRTSYRVLENDRPLDLTPKLLDLLFYFLDRPATLVTREELLAAVWPGANVTDNALAQAISDLRDALGDSAAEPRYIRTVARRGYRFVSAVDKAGPVAERPVSAPVDGPQPIAVLDFENVTAAADVAWLGAGIAETVTSDLAALDHFRVTDRWRVVQTSRLTDGSIHEIAAALGVGLVVTGSYQRAGPNIRITARIVDLQRGEALADAKVDGRVDDVFSLQDGIVSAFARDLGLPRAGRTGARETASLEAYRAYTEGWLKIESLDTGLIDASIRDFERAIGTDPRYAIAFTGLANAELAAYETTRATRQPNLPALEAGLRHARHAIELDDGLAEGHATLSFLLKRARRFEEARAAARRAVALEPESWRHQYRLGHAEWGEARLRALERTASLYPQFAYASFEAAMVHVARGRFDAAEQIVRQHLAGQAPASREGERFPALGFHWLLGAMCAARADFDQAIQEFDRELAHADRSRLYGLEYGALAHTARGHAELALGRLDAATKSFEGAATFVDGFVRSPVGLACVLMERGDRSGAERALKEATLSLVRASEATLRPYDAQYAVAAASVLRGDADAAVRALAHVVDWAPVSFEGWMLTLEPMFQPLAGHAAFERVLRRLAERAL